MGSSVAVMHRAPGHTSLVADATVVRACGGHLGVGGGMSLLVSAPERLAARTLGVVVRGGRAVALLLLVMLDEEEIEGGAHEEEEETENGHGEACGVEGACVAEVAGTWS